MNILMSWVEAREELRQRREAGLSPWTTDPILQQYRFCNAFREDDAVTRWLKINWREPNKSDPDLWFAMVVARHINLPETLEELGYTMPWDGQRFISILNSRKQRGLVSYSGAYMIRAEPSLPGQGKASYLNAKVFMPLWQRRSELRPKLGDTLEEVHKRLESCFGLGSFMAAQVVADIKYAAPLLEASDWWEFAASGPGSRRGLNRVLGRPVDAPWKEQDWRRALAKLRLGLKPLFEEAKVLWCHAQDTQHQLCEVDKYQRVKLGEGVPKRKYVRSMLS